MIVITALYAGILGLFAMVLASLAGNRRGKLKVSIGDGGSKDLHLAVRRHGNFVEYVPLILILLGIMELNGVQAAALHSLGAALVVFRICHAVGLKADTVEGLGRLIGAAGTALVLVVCSLWNIVLFFQ